MKPENSPFAGSKLETGPIDICQVCMNRSELGQIPGDNRFMCEDCSKAILHGRKQKAVAPALASPSSVTMTPVVVHSDEKELYLYTIRGKITEEQIEEVVRDLVEKRVLQFDFNRIIENDRWFSLMDLRRLTLRVDKNADKTKPKPELATSQMIKQPLLKKKPVPKKHVGGTSNA